MKIAGIKVFECVAGWRPWFFVKVETDEGMVGWGEGADEQNPRGFVGCVSDFARLLIGEDPRAIELRYWDMRRASRSTLGGPAHRAIAAIELALWDLKGRALGVPVYELLGGPVRQTIPLYWSHCGTTRVEHAHHVGATPLRTFADVTELGREVTERGFTALKTNSVLISDSARVYRPGFEQGPGSTDGVITAETLDLLERYIATLRAATGPAVAIGLDLNFNFRPEAAVAIGRRLAPHALAWLEMDSWFPAALAEIRRSIRTPVWSGENLITPSQYYPYFTEGSFDVCMVDVLWNGLAVSKRIAELAELFEHTIAPHNLYSPLGTLIAAHLCAVVPNVRMLEFPVDDVDWRRELITPSLRVEEGHLIMPTAPGWGADVNEAVVAAHAPA